MIINFNVTGDPSYRVMKYTLYLASDGGGRGGRDDPKNKKKITRS